MENNVFKRLYTWRKDRHLPAYDHKSHVKCVAEELFEMMGYDKDETNVALGIFLNRFYKPVTDMDVIVDAACDSIIYNINFMEQAKYYGEKAIHETINEISSREGAYDEGAGKWCKNPNQDPSTLYKADYNSCKYPDSKSYGWGYKK